MSEYLHNEAISSRTPPLARSPTPLLGAQFRAQLVPSACCAPFQTAREKLAPVRRTRVLQFAEHAAHHDRVPAKVERPRHEEIHHGRGPQCCCQAAHGPPPSPCCCCSSHCQGNPPVSDRSCLLSMPRKDGAEAHNVRCSSPERPSWKARSLSFW